MTTSLFYYVDTGKIDLYLGQICDYYKLWSSAVNYAILIYINNFSTCGLEKYRDRFIVCLCAFYYDIHLNYYFTSPCEGDKHP